MTELWYKNPKVLFDNLDQFYPSNSYTNIQKNNAMIRFAIYCFIILLLSNQNTKLLAIPLVIIIFTYFLGEADDLETLINTTTKKPCSEPTVDNPFMNYTIGDLITNPNKLKACDYDSSKQLMKKSFNTHLHTDLSDIWGKFINDRNYYTMPNTEIVNDQMGFAKWCYGNSGNCKTYGTNCLKHRDPEYHKGRYETLSFSSKEKDNITSLGFTE
jgi:hypothetical protein